MDSNHMTLIYQNTSDTITVEIKNRYTGNKVAGFGSDEHELRDRLTKELKVIDNE